MEERCRELFQKLGQIVGDQCKLFAEIARLGGDLSSVLQELGEKCSQEKCCADVGMLQKKTQSAFEFMLQKLTEVREKLDCISQQKEARFGGVAPELELVVLLLELGFQQYQGEEPSRTEFFEQTTPKIQTPSFSSLFKCPEEPCAPCCPPSTEVAIRRSNPRGVVQPRSSSPPPPSSSLEKQHNSYSSSSPSLNNLHWTIPNHLSSTTPSPPNSPADSPSSSVFEGSPHSDSYSPYYSPTGGTFFGASEGHVSFPEDSTEKKFFGLGKPKRHTSDSGVSRRKLTKVEKMDVQDSPKEETTPRKKTRMKALLRLTKEKEKEKEKEKGKERERDSERQNLSERDVRMSSLSQMPQAMQQLSGFVFLEDPEDDLSIVTLQDLVKGLTTRSLEIHSGLSLRQSFFLTYKRFSSPFQLLKVFKEEFFSPADPFQEDLESWTKKKVGLKEILAYWIEESVSDFAENETNDLLFSFFSEMEKVKQFAPFGEYLRDIYAISLQKDLEKKEIETEEEKLPPMDLAWDLFNEEELANSLTLQEFRLFKKITFCELLDWNKKNREDFCSNISHLISISNKLSGWVTTELVKRTRLSERVKLFEKFISLAHHLLSLKNFSSCVAVVGGILNSSFWRMKRTWKAANTEVVESFHKIRHLVSHQANYGRYREFLNSSNPPCVPFIGVVLTDLTFIDDGNKDTQLGCINFQKFRLFAKVLYEFKSHTDGDFISNFDVKSSVVSSLLDFPLFTENEKAKYSNFVEPKDPEEAIATLLALYLDTKAQLSNMEAKFYQ